jgi:CTP:molybdopterin cytidylyltransferase MocA
MIAAVLLAGGEARRLGQPKGLVLVQGERLLMRQVKALAAAGVVDVALSLGANGGAYVDVWPELARDVVSYPTPYGAVTLHVVADPRSRFGPFGSLVAGVMGLALRDWQRVLVAPMDVPIAPQVVGALAGVSAEAVVPRFEGKGGHPVLLTRELALSLTLRDPETSRLDVILRELPLRDRVDIVVEASEVVTNLNTPEAVARFS